MWVFAAGSQIATSQAVNPALVGAPGTWTDGNRDTHGTGAAADDTCKVPSSYGEGYADAFFATPDVGYIVAASFSEVFFTANNLASTAQKKTAGAGNAGNGGRVIAGDPANPSRMWSVNGTPYGRSTTAYTRDGWQTSDWFEIGNDTVREFPSTGPADVDFVRRHRPGRGRRRPRAQLHRRRQLLLQRRRGRARHPALERGRPRLGDRRRGRRRQRQARADDGREQHPRPARAAARGDADPQPGHQPAAGDAAGSAPAADLHAHRQGQRRPAKLSGGKVKVVVKGKIKVPSGVSAKTACTGTVQMTIKKGKTLLTARNAKLSKTCTFTKTISLAKSKVGATKSLAITVRFQGNAILKPTTKNLTAKIKR